MFVLFKWFKLPFNVVYTLGLGRGLTPALCSSCLQTLDRLPAQIRGLRCDSESQRSQVPLRNQTTNTRTLENTERSVSSGERSTERFCWATRKCCSGGDPVSRRTGNSHLWFRFDTEYKQVGGKDGGGGGGRVQSPGGGEETSDGAAGEIQRHFKNRAGRTDERPRGHETGFTAGAADGALHDVTLQYVTLRYVTFNCSVSKNQTLTRNQLRGTITTNRIWYIWLSREDQSATAAAARTTTNRYTWPSASYAA